MHGPAATSSCGARRPRPWRGSAPGLGCRCRSKTLAAGPDFGCKCNRQLATTGADVSHRHVQLERKLVPSAEASRVHGTKAKATPAIAANAHDHCQKDDGRCAPSVPRDLLFPSVAWAERVGRVAREAHSQRRTEALYSRYSRPNRSVRYRSSRGTTTRAIMATVASNVATSHRLLTQIARPRCNAKNAR